MRGGTARERCGTCSGVWRIVVHCPGVVLFTGDSLDVHRDMELDVIGLLETDLHVSVVGLIVSRSGARLLMWYVAYRVWEP